MNRPEGSACESLPPGMPGTVSEIQVARDGGLESGTSLVFDVELPQIEASMEFSISAGTLSRFQFSQSVPVANDQLVAGQGRVTCETLSPLATRTRSTSGGSSRPSFEIGGIPLRPASYSLPPMKNWRNPKSSWRSALQRLKQRPGNTGVTGTSAQSARRISTACNTRN
jgi:hypothetical protein